MKLQMKREALQKLERQANEMKTPFGTVSGTVIEDQWKFIWHTFGTVSSGARNRNWFRMKRNIGLGV